MFAKIFPPINNSDDHEQQRFALIRHKNSFDQLNTLQNKFDKKLCKSKNKQIKKQKAGIYKIWSQKVNWYAQY